MQSEMFHNGNNVVFNINPLKCSKLKHKSHKDLYLTKTKCIYDKTLHIGLSLHEIEVILF